MMNHPEAKFTDAEIKTFRDQLNDAENKLIERWKELAQNLDDMARIVGGGVTDEDTELVMKCVETCVAQCMLFGTEYQLQQIEAQHSGKRSDDEDIRISD